MKGPCPRLRIARPGLLSDQRDLEVGGAVLLRIKPAAVDIPRARSDGVSALPQHVAANLDPRERHGPVRVGRVDDLELESIGWQIFECALEVERFERAVCVLARPYLRRDALPVSKHRFL